MSNGEKELLEKRVWIVYFDETGCVYNGDSLLKNKNEGDKSDFTEWVQ